MKEILENKQSECLWNICPRTGTHDLKIIELDEQTYVKLLLNKAVVTQASVHSSSGTLWSINWGSWHCTGDRDPDHPHGKEMQKSKMAVWGGLTNSCEKKTSEKQRRKGKI